jgi:TolB protein
MKTGLRNIILFAGSVLGLIVMAVLLLSGCKGTSIQLGDEKPIPQDITPAWSPDGSSIAYAHISINPNDTIYKSGIYIIDTNGNQRRVIINGPVYNPSWSHDGNKIAFDGGGIFTITQSGDDLFLVTHRGRAFFPSWSPDDKSIAYDVTDRDALNGIWIISIDGVLSRYLGLGRDPDWSPNGRFLVYEGPPGPTESEDQIWTADTSGSSRKQLTRNSSITNRYPSWSPDGTKISWTGDGELWMMNSDGKNQRKITDGFYSAWSPDSRQIVFSRMTPQRDRVLLWRINIDGTGLTQITH